MIDPAILVPLDASSHSAGALPVARTLADMQRALLRVLRMAGAALSLREILEKLGVEAEVLEAPRGHPIRAIIEAAQERPDGMVVMSTQVGVSVPNGVLGRACRQVLLRVTCPVVLVRPDRGLAPWALRHVLLPHDGTPTTSAAIRPVCDLAGRAQARLSVLHAAGEGHLPPEAGTLPTPRYLDQLHLEWPAWSHEFLERFESLCPFAPSQLRLWLGRGRPESEIIRFAEEHAADLIVVAWRGTLEPQRARVFRAIVRDAPCPVMVLRAEAGREGK
jgi:nucleotide-binding universal stress UspA family protein